MNGSITRLFMDVNVVDPRTGGGAFDYQTLEALLLSLVTDVAATGSIAAGLTVGGIKLLRYYFPNVAEPELKVKFLVGAIVSVLLVMAAYSMRLALHADYFSPERLYAVLKVSYGVIIGCVGLIAAITRAKPGDDGRKTGV